MHSLGLAMLDFLMLLNLPAKCRSLVSKSTAYIGCTEEDCVPILERESGLKFGIDFKLGYSRELINQDDKVHTLVNTIEIVLSGHCIGVYP